MPRCSVVIPWYRGIDDLRRAVDSVLAQDESDFEIIVVANGVDAAIVAELEALYDDPRYKVVHIAEAGASLARNHGQAIATGSLIFFLDGDDRFHSGKLSRFISAQQETGFDVAFSRGTRQRGGGVTWPWPVGHWDGRQPVADFFFCDGCTISSSAIVVAARVKDRINFDASLIFYEDPDLIIRAEGAGMKVVMLADELYDWFDDRDFDRLSRTVDWNARMRWIDNPPTNISARARAAYRARCVAQHVFPGRFFTCLSVFANALTHRAVPARDIAKFMVRGFIPKGLRQSLVNRYFVKRAAMQTDVGRSKPIGRSLS